ncbi:MAG: glycine zipper 2TM domain-containing protein [Pseudomonadota bacterium]
MIQKLFSSGLLAGGLALCLTPAAVAQYDYGYGHNDGYYQQHYPTRVSSPCKREKDENRLAGAVVGAVAGGLLGSAIGENADDNNDRYHYRSYRGYRGYRGYRSHRRYHRHRDSDDNQVAGAVIGAVLGGVVGSELAASTTDCHQSSVSGYRYGDVPSPTRRPHSVTRDYGYTHSAPQPVSTRTRTVRVEEEPLYGGPTYESDCQTVQRETRMPDGSVIREPVSVCRSGNGRWEFTDSEVRY